MDALETVVRGAYELGALGATDEAAAFYAARGWMLWRGPSSALTRPASGVPRKTMAASMSCRCRSRWICPASWHVTGATAICGRAARFADQARGAARPQTGPVGRNDGGACGDTVPAVVVASDCNSAERAHLHGQCPCRYPSQEPPDRRWCASSSGTAPVTSS